jgi:GAF domain-containing protein
VQDITAVRLAQDALRARERHLGFITGLNDALRGLDDPVALSFEAARRLGEFLGADRVGHAEDAGDGESVVVTRNFTRGVPAIEGRYRYDDYGPALLEAFRAGRTVVRPDIAHDPDLTDAEKAAHAVLGLGATVNVPLLKGGRLHAVFFVHARTARA